MMSPRKRTRGRPRLTPGERPVSVLVQGPALLISAVETAALREGCSIREWWRRAARARLGWREVLP
jgi:hypothetical protein